MLQMQRKLNENINPLWESEGYDWNSAILVETAEAIDHTNWKWWKYGETNTPALQMELVDIWHFLLSKTLENYSWDTEARQYIVQESIGAAYKIEEIEEAETIPELLQEFVVLEVGEDSGMELFLAIVNHAGMTTDSLYSMYMGKNVLNRFRQEHGYKEGTYIKEWNGREDNEHLVDILSTIPISEPLYEARIYAGLTEVYRTTI
jgi:dimeric dUTPase (all-alpha-NTP-PPase superfamily)